MGPQSYIYQTGDLSQEEKYLKNKFTSFWEDLYIVRATRYYGGNSFR